MRTWMKRFGSQYKTNRGRPNYLGGKDQPFPENASFRSQPVLSEESREEIWRRVIVNGEAIKTVSATFGVDMRRVAAVVRLKEVEKSWISQGKSLALPYARAVMCMLPQANVQEGASHEPINEIHVHSLTMQQLFLPTSESRHFTREDAAKAFGDKMLPADKRVPHPELIQLEKDILGGKKQNEARKLFVQSAMASESALAQREQWRREKEEKRKTKVDSGRFEFRFEDINVDDAGKDGRSRKGTGWRYGVPYYDRRRGEVKIPTKVE